MTMLLEKLEENNIPLSLLETMIDDLTPKLQGLAPWKLFDAVQICRLLHDNDVSIFFQLDNTGN